MYDFHLVNWLVISVAFGMLTAVVFSLATRIRRDKELSVNHKHRIGRNRWKRSTHTMLTALIFSIIAFVVIWLIWLLFGATTIG